MSPLSTLQDTGHSVKLKKCIFLGNSRKSKESIFNIIKLICNVLNVAYKLDFLTEGNILTGFLFKRYIFFNQRQSN